MEMELDLEIMGSISSSLLIVALQLTNILLTENNVPRLADFGLAKMLQMEETKVFTDVRGTIGYMDPEYITHSKLTCASCRVEMAD
jgi:serine/threonine protein kinase